MYYTLYRHVQTFQTIFRKRFHHTSTHFPEGLLSGVVAPTAGGYISKNVRCNSSSKHPNRTYLPVAIIPDPTSQLAMPVCLYMHTTPFLTYSLLLSLLLLRLCSPSDNLYYLNSGFLKKERRVKELRNPDPKTSTPLYVPHPLLTTIPPFLLTTHTRCCPYLHTPSCIFVCLLLSARGGRG